MQKALWLFLVLLFSPNVVLACGGGDVFFEITLWATILGIMTPAFLVPFAGIVSLPTSPSTRTVILLILIALVTALTAPTATILFGSPEWLTLTLMPLCVLGVAAPSVLYAVLSSRARRIRGET